MFLKINKIIQIFIQSFDIVGPLFVKILNFKEYYVLPSEDLKFAKT